MSTPRLHRAASILAGVAILLLTLTSAHALDVDIGIKIGDKNPERAESHKHAPPDHAPAHGYRAKHSYHYYPASEVYFDSGRGMYFYLSDSRWTVSAKLPLSLKARLGEHVTIEMESDKPYSEHESHKKKYPPGHDKHKDKHDHEPGRGNGNGHGKGHKD